MLYVNGFGFWFLMLDIVFVCVFMQSSIAENEQKKNQLQLQYTIDWSTSFTCSEFNTFINCVTNKNTKKNQTIVHFISFYSISFLMLCHTDFILFIPDRYIKMKAIIKDNHCDNNSYNSCVKNMFRLYLL